jgi:hypothetical protein
MHSTEQAPKPLHTAAVLVNALEWFFTLSRVTLTSRGLTVPLSLLGRADEVIE